MWYPIDMGMKSLIIMSQLIYNGGQIITLAIIIFSYCNLICVAYLINKQHIFYLNRLLLY